MPMYLLIFFFLGTIAQELIDKPKCMHVEFSQRKLRYGNLERLSGNRGRLTFKKNVRPETLAIYFRMHPRGTPDSDPFEVMSASSLSLAWTLDALSAEQRSRTVVNVFLNTNNETEFKALIDWSAFLFSNRTAFAVYKCPAGNMESYECMMNSLVTHSNTPGSGVNSQTIIYLVEDDYLHLHTATQELIDVFSSHNPCFAVPYDYPDRYYMPDFNDDDGSITILAGKQRHWRTISSTTVTLAARVETMLYFHRLGMLPHPMNDYYNSLSLQQAGASILSPIPGMSSHVEKYDDYRSYRTEHDDSSEYVSLYFDWFSFAESIINLIKSDDFGSSMWRLVGAYSKSRNDMHEQEIILST